MATETIDVISGDGAISDKSSTEALSLGGDEETPAAAASGDRDAAVDLLLDEIRGLKQERFELSNECHVLKAALSDAQEKLARTDSELNDVASRSRRLEEQLRSAQEDLSAAKLSVGRFEEQLSKAHEGLSAAKLAAVKHQDELLRLNSSIENLQAMQAKAIELENMIKLLEEELKVSKQKIIDKDDKVCRRELEVTAIIQELKSELATEKEKNLNIINENDSKVSLMQSQSARAAAMVGAVALAAGAGAIVYLRLSKHTEI